MKKIIILLVILFSSSVIAGERMGPSDVTDYYLEPSISAYITSVGNTDDDNVVAPGLMASLWYVKYEVDFGVEALGSDSSGIFLSARYPVDNQWNVAAGIGKLGYAVDTRAGSYYAKPTGLMLFSDYQTEYGKIIARFIYSESGKNYTDGSQVCVHTSALPDNHLDSCSGGNQLKTNNAQQVIMLGFQVDL